MTNPEIQEVTGEMASYQPGTKNELVARAKLYKIEAELLERTAIAAEETASSTRRSAFWIMGSVIVMTVSVIANLIITLNW
ncbi:MAG: hypothetical protein HOF36_01400 [Candidatus Marinimicrobia bacterium]|jgi:hypothetical protein|nr:hypothetical protein [Candidatus Neomarinimicrobiota bacterium]MBT3949710.1 hypothetical protein [Candidatus Neomarinimicrobiota bacterium]MBT4253139.1 hypothetical protein [Candidatus Neomarinimicrobiota bacterium]MBT4419154.1 hypothetical protein [Candidatus Neomarinimicrobiota bacterium]MBT5467383.1 hypothetical protein [Candidatus Neomarinimicrobiota bacterium]